MNLLMMQLPRLLALVFVEELLVEVPIQSVELRRDKDLMALIKRSIRKVIYCQINGLYQRYLEKLEDTSEEGNFLVADDTRAAVGTDNLVEDMRLAVDTLGETGPALVSVLEELDSFRAASIQEKKS